MAQLRATGQQRIDELPASSVFARRYRIVRRIGTGGFGAVYEAQHAVTGRRCALKLLWPHLATEEAFRKRFLQEARLATQLHSEHIVDVLDAGIDTETDTPFLVMEYLDGEDLGTRVKRKRRFSPEETIVYLSQLAVGLDRTHGASIIHRDLKPENLFLTKWSDGSPLVKILDFGIAKLVAEQSAHGPSQSAGTPLYMAPEQFQQGPATPAVDIYALGMIAFRFLVGRHYFAQESRESENAYALLVRLSQGPAEPATMRAARSGVQLPPAFDAWFQRATHVDRAQRFGSAATAVLALANVLGVEAREPLLTKKKPRLTGALSHGVETGSEAPIASTALLKRAMPSGPGGVTEAGGPPTSPYSARTSAAPGLAATVSDPSAEPSADDIGPTVSSSLLETAPATTVSPPSQQLPQPAATMSIPAPAPRALPWLVAVLGFGAAIAAAVVVVAIAVRPTPKTAQELRLRLAETARARMSAPAVTAAPTASTASAESSEQRGSGPAAPAILGKKSAKPEGATPSPPSAPSSTPPAASAAPVDLYSRE